MQINSISYISYKPKTPNGKVSSFGSGFNLQNGTNFYYERPSSSKKTKTQKTVEKLKRCAAETGRAALVIGSVLTLSHKINQENKRSAHSQELAPISINTNNYGDFSPAILGGRGLYYLNVFNDSEYKTETNEGINEDDDRASDADIYLAKYSKEIADYLETMSYCYTGVKHAFLSAGIIDKYEDMPKGNAKNAKKYFEENQEKFRKIEVNKDELKNLPAGRIIVYSHQTLPGHIAITNGSGQEMSDHTGNMRWLDKHPDGDFDVYELTDNWKVDYKTKKLYFDDLTE